MPKPINLTTVVLGLVEQLGRLPLPVLRCLGVLLGLGLYVGVGSRRRVVRTNMSLCFPHWTSWEIRLYSLRTFVGFAQAWLDRGWLWTASPELLRRRLKLVGACHELDGQEPTVLFAPHFFGLDAAWTALTLGVPRRFTTIYTDQQNKTSDAWILRGRRRFGSPNVLGRVDGVKPVLASLKRSEPLYLLPDMNFGPEESLFVPFYGVPAATVPSLSRFAKLGRAKVVPVIARMTAQGYSIELLPAWRDFPTADLRADTATMNLRLQGYIDAMPAQYYWVHKRFKDRPDGEAGPY
ncbi:lipid A biosynthesis acyltransferase [Rhodoferax aquaticus]|uniref:Lipid A biosynthesis acyltransferase n=1 Tax=Rhodoferax aquaticus TaxID=2527691 RepID=A0A515ET21_9BURK|nr:lipid A biosynthesis acyltransferase [Rhodoferax aquaticus]QDL55801.1 lipid A biosynthesis acyltransferase [Rhodoferax aquaticus]